MAVVNALTLLLLTPLNSLRLLSNLK